MSSVLRIGAEDLERIDRIAGQVSNDDAEWLRARLLDRRDRAALVRAQRDRLIVVALDRLSALPPTVAAKRLGVLLEERARAFDAPAAAGSMAALADQILQLNGYATLGWRAIHGIAAGKKATG